MPIWILNHWTSNHSNARLEELNGIFQAVRARARGYHNVFASKSGPCIPSI
ncbi:hypothetical protein DFAR_3200004 [Desulfarculales bacterium]